MAIGSCHGAENKRRIVNGYTISPIAHVRLLEGQERVGCCGPVSSRYYHFEAKAKSDGKIETFIVGYDCAEQLLELAKKEKLPLFNPLAAVAGQSGAAGRAASAASGKHRAPNPREQMGPLNAELYDAIHLLCTAWSTTPGKELREMLRFLVTFPDRERPDFVIIHFNNIVGSDFQGRSLTAMLHALRTVNPTLRQFAFPTINALLARIGYASHL